MSSTALDRGMTCASCNSVDLTCRPEADTFTYGIGDDAVTLQAPVQVFHCNTCEFEFTGPSAEVARHDAVCQHLEIMTPTEVRSVRECYGLSRSEFAALTRLGEASIGRWEAGSHVQNRAYDSFLFLLQFEDNYARLLSRRKNTSDASQEWSTTNSVFQCIQKTEQVRREQSVFELRPHLVQEAA